MINKIGVAGMHIIVCLTFNRKSGFNLLILGIMGLVDVNFIFIYIYIYSTGNCPSTGTFMTSHSAYYESPLAKMRCTVGISAYLCLTSGLSSKGWSHSTLF